MAVLRLAPLRGATRPIAVLTASRRRPGRPVNRKTSITMKVMMTLLTAA